MFRNNPTTSLMICVFKGPRDMVQKFIDLGENVHAKDHNGLAEIMHAVRARNAPGVQCLLENGADVDERDNEGHTALMLAVKYYHVSVVECLLNIGAYVFLLDKSGKTAIEHASDELRQQIMDNFTMFSSCYVLK